ncbi:(2Fe-2S)-binding protein [Clostridium culturomicium]|uniref:(2Fe-2S)-binding protein n=1 Tax=Clostridium culturomicium TaxID=1499683 RepID=UPI00058FA20C|nr:(2Fe-2S)-binding protein [Clostridium culturomicium]
MVKVSLNINDKIYEKVIDPEMRLVDFIRDEARLKGTKEGCGEGECGACTVIVNGKSMNSCLLLAVSMEGKEIITIEGVAAKELHPLQQAFMEVGAVQCGYCTPGMILSAKALLDENLQVSEEDIREAISGNLCRCTGYEKIVEGVLTAQQMLQNQDSQEIISLEQENSAAKILK